MIKKLKVMTIVGTRPEIIRLACVMKKLDRHTQHLLVHTGQNYDYELNEIFFDELGLRKPDFFLEAASGTAVETIANVISRTDLLLEKESPDAVLILGDTNSALAVIAAKRRRVPIFHMEAGNRCFDQRVPEETNRKIADHLADINMPYSEIAREYLLREGFSPDRIIKTGSPLFEVINNYMSNINNSNILQSLALEAGKYFVVSCHREENIESPKNFARLVAVLNGLASRFQEKIIVSAHPRMRKRVENSGTVLDPLVKLMKPLGFPDYIHLQRNARVVLSDSGTITEESSIINFPALNIRDAHERPEGMEEAAVMMTGLNFERIIQAISVIAEQPRAHQRALNLVRDYSMPNVSDKVLRIILSYTDYVNQTVWRL